MDRDILKRINKNARYSNSSCKSRSKSNSNDSVIRLERSSVSSEFKNEDRVSLPNISTGGKFQHDLLVRTKHKRNLKHHPRAGGYVS